MRPRLAALLRHALSLPGAAELAALRDQVRELRAVVTALASERVAFTDPETGGAAVAEARDHASDVCRRYMACRRVA